MSEMKIDRIFFMVKLLDFSGRLIVARMTGGKRLGSFRACLMEPSETEVVTVQSAGYCSPWVNICSLIYSAKNLLGDLLQLYN